MQKVDRACAECARQGGETPSLRGPGIRGACIQGFGPKKSKKKVDHVRTIGEDVLNFCPKILYISDENKSRETLEHYKMSIKIGMLTKTEVYQESYERSIFSD